MPALNRVWYTEDNSVDVDWAASLLKVSSSWSPRPNESTPAKGAAIVPLPTKSSGGRATAVVRTAPRVNENDPPPYLATALQRVNQIAEASQVLNPAADEARSFLTKLTSSTPRPTIWSDDESEIVFEWLNSDRHAIVSFEGDGSFGYALKMGDRFVPGSFVGSLASGLPSDLLDYLDTK